MADEKQSGLKSSFDLAMERLEKKNGRMVSLSEEQKKAIAEIENKTRAKIAELEILMGKSLAEARARGDEPEKIRKLEEQKKFEIDKLKANAEEDKEQARRGK